MTQVIITITSSYKTEKWELVLHILKDAEMQALQTSSKSSVYHSLLFALGSESL